MEKKEKRIYFEVMRIVACFFVIFNHTSVNGYFLFSTREPGSAHFWIELFVSVFCKFAVPLFLAIFLPFLPPSSQKRDKNGPQSCGP